MAMKLVFLFTFLFYNYTCVLGQSIPRDSIEDANPNVREYAEKMYANMVEKSLFNKINELDSLLDRRIFIGNFEDSKCEHIGVSANLKSTKIAFFSMLIATVSCLLTLLLLFYQSIISRGQRKDIKNERIESRLFNYIDRYNTIVGNIEILNIGKGSKVFNFLFYEYEMLFKEFVTLKLKSKITNKLFTAEELSSIAISFVINGISSNSDGGTKDLIYSKYSNILSLDDYDNLKSVVNYYENEINDNQLLTLYQSEKYTLISNFADIQLKEKKRVPWFWGIRYYYMPYVKVLSCMLGYVSDKKKADYYRIIECSMSDHELGLLYAFSCSYENTVGLKKELVEILIKLSGLSPLYNFKTWETS